MAVNYDHIISDIEEHIGAAGLVPTTVDKIFFNYEKVSPAYAKSIRPEVFTTVTDQTEITGDDSGVETSGFLRVRIFNKTGNDQVGYQIGTVLGGVFNKLTLTDRGVTRFRIGEMINVGQSEELEGFYETVFVVEFTAKTP